jgi:hypothetical protein
MTPELKRKMAGVEHKYNALKMIIIGGNTPSECNQSGHSAANQRRNEQSNLSRAL